MYVILKQDSNDFDMHNKDYIEKGSFWQYVKEGVRDSFYSAA